MLLCPPDIFPGYCMPIGKASRKGSVNPVLGKDLTQRREWRQVMDFISEGRAFRVLGITDKAMPVPPPCKGSLDLEVSKLAALFNFPVFSDPASPERADLYFQCSAVAVFDGCIIDNMDILPGWAKSLKGTGQGVPVLEFFSRAGDGRGFLEG